MGTKRATFESFRTRATLQNRPIRDQDRLIWRERQQMRKISSPLGLDRDWHSKTERAGRWITERRGRGVPANAGDDIGRYAFEGVVSGRRRRGTEEGSGYKALGRVTTDSRWNPCLVTGRVFSFPALIAPLNLLPSSTLVASIPHDNHVRNCQCSDHPRPAQEQAIPSVSRRHCCLHCRLHNTVSCCSYSPAYSKLTVAILTVHLISLKFGTSSWLAEGRGFAHRAFGLNSNRPTKGYRLQATLA